jgi:hypothetical protein
MGLRDAPGRTLAGVSKPQRKLNPIIRGVRMRRELYQMFASALIGVCVLGTFAAAQTDTQPPALKIKNFSPQKNVQITKEMVSAAIKAAGSATLPVWNYEVVVARRQPL